jgi:hypothetical protein
VQLLRRGQARFQSVDFLLLVGNLLLQRVDLSFTGGVVLVIRIRQIAVLLQRELALSEIGIFFRVGYLLFQLSDLGVI